MMNAEEQQSFFPKNKEYFKRRQIMCATELVTPTKPLQEKDYFSGAILGGGSGAADDVDSYDPLPDNATLDGIPVRREKTPVFTMDDP